jgi:pyruvate dehydrogenase E2 component (dihydrolipoamide acetyltransferase)
MPATPGTEAAMTKMRRAIGVNLQTSSRDTPHFHVTMSIDMTAALAVRERLNAGKAKEEKISVNDLVVRAVALGLKAFPAVNCRMSPEGDKIVYHAGVNVGVATAVPDGLVVPVVTDTDQKGWAELAAQTKRVSGEARKGKIIGAGKGTFTVSNLGLYGVEEFTAIINPPEAAILAVGAVKPEVVAVEGMIGIRPMMRVTLCSDHRLIDGALAAQFLQFVKGWLETQIS